MQTLSKSQQVILWISIFFSLKNGVATDSVQWTILNEMSKFGGETLPDFKTVKLQLLR